MLEAPCGLFGHPADVGGLVFGATPQFKTAEARPLPARLPYPTLRTYLIVKTFKFGALHLYPLLYTIHLSSNTSFINTIIHIEK